MADFYVDPSWGGTKTGAPITPWSVLDAGAWATINAQLASTPVTVYFTARPVGSDTNYPSTGQLDILRTNGSSNRLTLDGASQYNTNAVTPTWAGYSGASRHQVTSSSPVQSANVDSPFPPRNYVTIRGFHLISTGGQIAVMAFMSHAVLEDCDCSATIAAVIGPGIYVGRSNSGMSEPYPSDIIIQDCAIHDTFGEAIYVGGTGEDPPGTLSEPTNDGVQILRNTIDNAGTRGGQGDGIDVKCGQTNCVIRGNKIRRTLPSLNGIETAGIVVESGDVIDGNFVADQLRHGIITAGAYANAFGRDGLQITNNVIAEYGPSGISVYGGTSAGFKWANVEISNNTISGGAGSAIVGAEGTYDTVQVHNNIVTEAAEWGLTFPAGKISAHSHNLFHSSGAFAVKEGGTNYPDGSLTTWEPTGLTSDPLLVAPGDTSEPENYAIQPSSPAAQSGTTRGFTTDFLGITRVEPWDRGAFAFPSDASPSTEPEPEPEPAAPRDIIMVDGHLARVVTVRGER